MDRRTFLRTSVSIAATVALPSKVKGIGLSPEELEVRAQELARTAVTLPPAQAQRVVCSHLRLVETAIIAAPWSHQRRDLHRTAALTGLTAAQVGRWGGHNGGADLLEAEAQARAADDGPLLARVWLERAAAVGTDALAVDAPSPAALDLVTAALYKAGCSHSAAPVRAAARHRLAWEFAAEGDERGALMELDAAAIEAQHGGWSHTDIASNAGTTLRKLGRLGDAHHALTVALDTPPVRRTAVLCDIARLHAAQRDADAAAAALEEAFLLVRAHGIVGRQYRILAARRTLPDCAAVRQLDAVTYGA